MSDYTHSMPKLRYVKYLFLLNDENQTIIDFTTPLLQQMSYYPNTSKIKAD